MSEGYDVETGVFIIGVRAERAMLDSIPDPLLRRALVLKLRREGWEVEDFHLKHHTEWVGGDHQQHQSTIGWFACLEQERDGEKWAGFISDPYKWVKS